MSYYTLIYPPKFVLLDCAIIYPFRYRLVALFHDVYLGTEFESRGLVPSGQTGTSLNWSLISGLHTHGINVIPTKNVPNYSDNIIYQALFQQAIFNNTLATRNLGYMYTFGFTLGRKGVSRTFPERAGFTHSTEPVHILYKIKNHPQQKWPRERNSSFQTHRSFLKTPISTSGPQYLKRVLSCHLSSVNPTV